MLSRGLSSTAGLVGAAVAGLLVLSSASYANSYDQIFPGALSNPHAHARALYHGGYGPQDFTTPRDFHSSGVCINGYRWITREYDRNDPPAESAVPVRCD